MIAVALNRPWVPEATDQSVRDCWAKKDCYDLAVLDETIEEPQKSVFMRIVA